MQTKPRLLIVEDDKVTAKYIQNLVERLGYHVVQIIAKGEDAVEQALATRPDLILMDIILEGKMNGIEAANQIQKTYQASVIYLTALCDEKTLQKARASGPFGYIVKPFVQRELEVILAAALYKEGQEQAMQDIEERYMFSLQHLKGVSVKSDLNFNPFFMEGPVESIIGYKAEDFIRGRLHWDEIVPPDDRPLFSKELRNNFKEIPQFQINKEFRVVHPQGDTRWLRYYIKNVCDAKQRPASLVGSICDMTHYRQMYDFLNKVIYDFDHLKQATIDREEKMIDLKKEVDALRADLGRAPKYNVSFK
jgi:PAS domain S-box-containing protein